MPGHSSAQPIDSAGHVLVFVPDAVIRQAIAADVSAGGYRVEATGCADLAEHILNTEPIDVCLVADENLQQVVEDLTAHIGSVGLLPQIVCVAPRETFNRWTSPAKLTCDCLEFPCRPERLIAVVGSAVKRSRLLAENRRLKQRFSNSMMPQLIGSSRAMQDLRERVREAAETDHPLLIRGEFGTDAQLVAQVIHTTGKRAHQAFIKVDCQFLSASALDRELFGGANTQSAGLEAPRSGRLTSAAGGTLFLDHIDCASLTAQKKLVALLSDSDIRRYGSPTGELLDMRVVAATRVDLTTRVRQGKFRDDLLQKLCRSAIQTPALRERPEDIGPLTESILGQLALEDAMPAKRLTPDALDLLEKHDWPGNSDELRSVLRRACTATFASSLTAETIHPWLTTRSTGEDHTARGLTLKQMERNLIEAAFDRCGGNRERTAQTLNIGLRTLSGKLREYGYPPRGGPGSNQEPPRRKAA